GSSPADVASGGPPSSSSPWPRRFDFATASRTQKTKRRIRRYWKSISVRGPASAQRLVGAVRVASRGDRLTHGGVGEHVPVASEVHHAEVARAERVGDGERHLRLGAHQLGPHLLHA